MEQETGSSSRQTLVTFTASQTSSLKHSNLADLTSQCLYNTG